MNKSLRVKLSATLMATVLVTMIISIVVNNFFLVDYYISGKQKALIGAYNKINQMYNTFGVSEEARDGIDGKNDIYQWFNTEDIFSLSDFLDMELSMEQLSQNNNMGILLYRIQNKRIINQQAVYSLCHYGSLSLRRGYRRAGPFPRIAPRPICRAGSGGGHLWRRRRAH